jgi:hypothetical protein
MKNILKYVGVLFVSVGFAQIGINNPTPNAKAELDISSTTKGILIPRMPRNAAVPSFGTITNLAANNGMLVYQTNTVGANLPGFYFHNFGWFPLRVTNGWSLFGNTGINPALNYVGTPDAFPLRFRTSNLERLSILADGKIGIGVVAPTTNLHLVGTPTTTLRIEDGFAASGNYLSSTADGTTIWRTPASLGFAGWSITGNAGTSSASNFLGTSDGQDFVVSTSGTEKVRIQGATGALGTEGNIRINVTSNTLSKLQVNSDLSTPTISSINTNTTAATFSYGLVAESNAISSGSSAIQGSIVDSGLDRKVAGVYGEFDGGLGTGIFGRGWISVGEGSLGNPLNAYPIAGLNFTNVNGVYGFMNYSGGDAVKGLNLHAGPGFGMYCQGNFAVGGGICTICNAGGTLLKSASVPTTKGNQLVYCKESPEMWFEDFGFGQLQNGSLHIPLDEMFLETVFIDNAHKMHVVLQEQAESNGLYVVIDADFKGFTVKEKKSGTSNAAFSYSIMAKRRFYQDHRFGVDFTQPYEDNLSKTKNPEILSSDPIVMKAYMEKITAEKKALAGISKTKQEDTKTKEASKTSN